MPYPTIFPESALRSTYQPSTPSSPTPSTPLSSAPGSPLSSAPSSPQHPTTPIKPRRCREDDCPIDHAHYKGVYFHRGQRVQETGTPFGDSNPPPHIWRAAERIRDLKGSEEDDLVFFGFMRYHGPKERTSGWAGEWRIKRRAKEDWQRW